MVDMTGHLNSLNTTLQGKRRTCRPVQGDVLVFEHKLTVLGKDVQSDTLSFFPSLKEFRGQNRSIATIYSVSLSACKLFAGRFDEFRKEKNTLLPFHALRY